MRARVERPASAAYLKREIQRLIGLYNEMALDRRSALNVAREAHELTKQMAADLRTQRADNARLRHELQRYGYDADF